MSLRAAATEYSVAAPVDIVFGRRGSQPRYLLDSFYLLKRPWLFSLESSSVHVYHNYIEADDALSQKVALMLIIRKQYRQAPSVLASSARSFGRKIHEEELWAQYR